MALIKISKVPLFPWQPDKILKTIFLNQTLKVLSPERENLKNLTSLRLELLSG